MANNTKMIIGALAVIALLAVGLVLTGHQNAPKSAPTTPTQPGANQSGQPNSNLTQFLNVTQPGDYNFTSNQTILSPP